eukprot:154687-Pelagomonas_calceolata.AAC.1
MFHQQLISQILGLQANPLVNPCNAKQEHKGTFSVIKSGTCDARLIVCVGTAPLIIQSCNFGETKALIRAYTGSVTELHGGGQLAYIAGYALSRVSFSNLTMPTIITP